MKRFHSKQVKCVYQSNVNDVPSPTSTPMAGLLSSYKANEMNSLPHALKLWGQSHSRAFWSPGQWFKIAPMSYVSAGPPNLFLGTVHGCQVNSCGKGQK